MNRTSLEHAVELTRRGFSVVPVPHASKRPGLVGWPRLRISESDLPNHFTGATSNIGVLWGEPSGNVVDVDLDHELAVRLGETLPATGAIWGRASKPRSHRLYRVRGTIETRQFSARRPKPGETNHETRMLAEIRADGSQTIAPGSVHPSGEIVRWDEEGAPGEIDAGELIARVQEIAERVFDEAGLAAEGWTKSWQHKSTKPTRHRVQSRPVSRESAIEKFLGALRGRGFTPRSASSGWSCQCPAHEDSRPSLSISVGDDGRVLLKCHSACSHEQIADAVGLTVADLFEGQRPQAAGGLGLSPAYEWPDPGPLPAVMPPALPFMSEWLPNPIRPWINDIAERMQCPIDFPSVAAMVAMSALIGRQVGIRPKRFDDWLVVPNLWGAVIGRPGVMKTPAIQEPLRPLNAMEMQAKAQFDEQTRAFEADEVVSDVRRKEAEKKIKGALSDRAEARRLAMESLKSPDEESAPRRRRYMVNDSTVEKLGEILNDNPNGVLVFRDELIGLLKSLDKEGQEGARSFFLEAWNGNGRYVFDRIGRGTIDIEAAIVSVLGGIQPGPLGDYLRGAVRQGVGDDGLMQRFQLLVYPEISKDWENVDRAADSAARRQADEVYQGLENLDTDLLGCERSEFDEQGIPFLRFDPTAQDAFDAWRTFLEHRVRSGDLVPAMESHLSKYRSLVPSLALIIHLAEGGRSGVTLAALERALGWAEFLESHAHRVFAHALRADLAAAAALSKKLLDGSLADGFAIRDVYRRGWSGLSTKEDVSIGVDFLTDLGWLRPEEIKTGGRAGLIFRINPKLLDAQTNSASPPPEQPTELTQAFPGGAADPSVSSVSPPGVGSDKNPRYLEGPDGSPKRGVA